MLSSPRRVKRRTSPWQFQCFFHWCAFGGDEPEGGQVDGPLKGPLELGLQRCKADMDRTGMLSHAMILTSPCLGDCAEAAKGRPTCSNVVNVLSEEALKC